MVLSSEVTELVSSTFAIPFFAYITLAAETRGWKVHGAALVMEGSLTMLTIIFERRVTLYIYDNYMTIFRYFKFRCKAFKSGVPSKMCQAA